MTKHQIDGEALSMLSERGDETWAHPLPEKFIRDWLDVLPLTEMADSCQGLLYKQRKSLPRCGHRRYAPEVP